jgi:hypothetical protein
MGFGQFINLLIFWCFRWLEIVLGHCWILVDLSYYYLIFWINFEVLGMRICRRWIFSPFSVGLNSNLASENRICIYFLSICSKFHSL